MSKRPRFIINGQLGPVYWTVIFKQENDYLLTIALRWSKSPVFLNIII